MEYVLVNDSCIIIDLCKLDILQDFLKLPYNFMMVDILIESELLSLSDNDKNILRQKFSIKTLTSQDVLKAYKYTQNNPKLSEYDCFSLVLAEKQKNVIFLTSDKALRNLSSQSIKTHGLLWIIDRLMEYNILSHDKILVILDKIKKDYTIRLPNHEIDKRIDECKNLFNQ